MRARSTTTRVHDCFYRHEYPIIRQCARNKLEHVGDIRIPGRAHRPCLTDAPVCFNVKRHLRPVVVARFQVYEKSATLHLTLSKVQL